MDGSPGRRECASAVRGSPSPSGSDGARSVYVHAPFCARRCVYCDFAVEVRKRPDPNEWLAALAAELAGIEAPGAPGMASTLLTLYVGGGTPSLLGPDCMEGLAGVLGSGRLADPELEWTAEANPESFAPDLAEGWLRAGVNRLSLGAQSFDEGALAWMGRLHGPSGIGAAVRSARSAGFDNLSLDLIFGLPGALGRSWHRDLELTLELEPAHISLYGLTVEAATPLGRAVREGRESPVDEERYREEYLIAAERLTAAGYLHYEVSNFALTGRASRHNTAYWSGDPYLGLGNGAHSYAHPVRRWNHREWETYRGAVQDGVSPEAGCEALDDEARRLEEVWLALRTSAGFDATRLPSTAVALVRGWTEEGLALASDDRIQLTADGWLVLDRLAVELDQELSG